MTAEIGGADEVMRAAMMKDALEWYGDQKNLELLLNSYDSLKDKAHGYKSELSALKEQTRWRYNLNDEETPSEGQRCELLDCDGSGFISTGVFINDKMYPDEDRSQPIGYDAWRPLIIPKICPVCHNDNSLARESCPGCHGRDL
jgi:hypothetical protein